jgi:hypothetical protein
MSEINKVIISINGAKFEQEIDCLNLNMPSEAAALLSLMKSQEVISKVSTTSMDLKSIIEDNISPSVSLVRQKPNELSVLFKQKNFIEGTQNEMDPVKKFSIDEDMGIALGIIVGLTKKSQISEIMKLSSKYSPDDNESLYFYNDLSLSIFFDRDDIVSEMKFGNLYKGVTNKGLSIGDTVEKSIELYGQPKLKSSKGAIWSKFAIFCEKNIITSIRIQR